MTIADEDLDLTLKALADPTRREILQYLANGDARVTEVAGLFPISLNSVSKHIRMLERAGLVRRQRRGREHLLSIDVQQMDAIATWMEQRRDEWSTRLHALDALLQENDRNEHQQKENEHGG